MSGILAMGGMELLIGVLIIAGLVAMILGKLVNARKMNTGVQTPNAPAANSNYCGVCKDVVVRSCPNANKIEAIKYVKEASGCSLAEAKNVVEGNVALQGIPVEVADELVAQLNTIGVFAETL